MQLEGRSDADIIESSNIDSDQADHTMKNCTKSKRVFTCYLCNRSEHIAFWCLNNARNNEHTNSGEVKLLNIQGESEAGRKFIREVQINSSTLTAQIDTGATICTIKGTTVVREGLKVTKVNSSLDGFRNNKVVSPGIITDEVKVENLKPRTLNLMIVSDTALKYEIILGQMFTGMPDLS